MEAVTKMENCSHLCSGKFNTRYSVFFLVITYLYLAFSGVFIKIYIITFRYMDSSAGLVTTAFLDFAVSNQATAENTFEKIDAKMKLYDINWSKCIAFSSDNASVMMGKNNSIYTRIAKSSPDVYPVGCACHLAHLCAKRAANQLSVDVEQLVIDLYYHFDKSSK